LGTDVTEAELLSARRRYTQVRAFTEALCEGLEAEDLVAQSMPDASPTKWHLAHTTWFFEALLLDRFDRDWKPFHPTYRFLFNSYYNSLGDRHARPQRGVLTRPTGPQVLEYRASIDRAILRLLESGDSDPPGELLEILEVGLHHEQQHQELILTDLKHLFSLNPLDPWYRGGLSVSASPISDLDWTPVSEGVYSIGHVGEGFAFDNESPSHRVYLHDYALANRPITNAEFLEFIEDGGYERPELWLDIGWASVQQEGWPHPLYWRSHRDGSWREFTLAGDREWAANEPVSHVSFLEADAFARWAGARLPTEAEWEVACAPLPVAGNFVESQRLHPGPHAGGSGIAQAFGDVWEWTRSSYSPYPGFVAKDGSLAEYNGKFMCNQIVLRGGSCVSHGSHLRASYRNFFHAPDRWQVSGIRLAKDVG
jgi:ergothioneine biosynthesis protein EgtB